MGCLVKKDPKKVRRMCLQVSYHKYCILHSKHSPPPLTCLSRWGHLRTCGRHPWLCTCPRARLSRPSPRVSAAARATIIITTASCSVPMCVCCLRRRPIYIFPRLNLAVWIFSISSHIPPEFREPLRWHRSRVQVRGGLTIVTTHHGPHPSCPLYHTWHGAGTQQQNRRSFCYCQ